MAGMNIDRTTSRYFQLLEALGQAVIVTNTEGEIALWSPAAKVLYGWRANEVIGRNVLDVTPMEVSRSQGVEIMEALARGELWSGEFEVRTRGGRRATASVTDIPLLDGQGAVAGVIGVSAVSRAPTKLRPLLKRFAAACDKVWPKQITFQLAVPASTRLQAAEPHMVQMLAVLMLLYADSLDRGHRIEFVAGTADKSPFADFGLSLASSAIYIRIDRRNQDATYSVLRNLPITAEPTKYASALVRMVSGMLIAGTAPYGLSAIHLFLPVEPVR